MAVTVSERSGDLSLTKGTTEQNIRMNNTEIKSAYRDAEGWILFGADGEPIEEWPATWPTVVDVAFLRERGIEIGA